MPDSSEKIYLVYSQITNKKEKDSLPIAAGNLETLYGIIGGEIMKGNMDYRGYARKKGFDLFREDYRHNMVSLAQVQRCYIEKLPLTLMGSSTVAPEWENTYS